MVNPEKGEEEMKSRFYTAKCFFRKGFPLFSMEKTRNIPEEFPPEGDSVGERDFYKIFYITEGTGLMEINGKCYPFAPGTVGVIHPNDFTTFRLREEIGLYNILFFRSFIADGLAGIHDTNHFFNVFDPSPDRSRNHDLLHLLDANRNILAQIRRMEQEFLANEPNSEFVLRLQLLELLVQLSRLSSRTYAKKRHGDLVRLIEEHLRSHLAEPFSMEELSKRFGLSTGYLHSLFRKQTGTTIGQMLLSLRVEEAKKLLGETSLPVERICYRCGFSDPSNFYRQFRRQTGAVPGAFRKPVSSGR